jgi:hypothetical protein
LTLTKKKEVRAKAEGIIKPAGITRFLNSHIFAAFTSTGRTMVKASARSVGNLA